MGVEDQVQNPAQLVQRRQDRGGGLDVLDVPAAIEGARFAAGARLGDDEGVLLVLDLEASHSNFGQSLMLLLLAAAQALQPVLIVNERW